MATEAAIMVKVQDSIKAYGQSIDVLKHAATSADLYQQGAKTFDVAVQVVGRAIRRPTADQLSMVGDQEDIELAVVFARLELMDAFATATENEWIVNDDEIGYEGTRYRILSTHLTARVKDYYSLVVCKCVSLVGSDSYP
jgi:phage tail tube protein FII